MQQPFGTLTALSVSSDDDLNTDMNRWKGGVQGGKMTFRPEKYKFHLIGKP